MKGGKAFRLRLSWGSFSSGQSVRPRCSRTCRGWRSGLGWPADGPAAVSRLARNIAVLWGPRWATGARPASEGDAAAWLRCGAAWLTVRWAGGWQREGRCKGRPLSTRVWGNHKGPSWKKKTGSKVGMTTDDLQQLQRIELHRS